MATSLDFLSRPESTAPPARRLPAWLLPVGILTGFGLLFAGLFRDRLLPAPTVEVAPVLVTHDAASATRQAGVPDSGGALLFQASGWVEPEPYAVRASALIDGVVAAVHVLEGQEVEKGQLLVSLVGDDAKLALAAAEQRHRMLVSARAAHLAAIEAIARRHEAAKAEVAAAKAIEAEADDQLARLSRLVESRAVAHGEFISARFRLQREKSLYQASHAKEAELAAEARRMALETNTKDDEIALAMVAVDQARLNLERTRIHAPLQGRVLRLTAAPGNKKMLSMEHPDSSTVCVLYEPDKLQVRVDVPLADAAGLQVGQKARIHTSLLSGRVFDGEVIRITGEADLQRNTLQAKVRLLNPADQLRPEMLCRVEFLGTGGSPAGGPGSTAPLVLWIPSQALREGSVWVCHPDTTRLARRTVLATNDTRDNHIRITEGLRPGEQVVLTPGDWHEGQRVHPQTIAP